MPLWGVGKKWNKRKKNCKFMLGMWSVANILDFDSKQKLKVQVSEWVRRECRQGSNGEQRGKVNI